ncbi:LysR family transcriptional regulator [Paenibacillus polymyxa]|uniref:LysR family transcriptional regulator n=1 Tax=Paenibacillus polymyxa TaxID=1406 RepID=UPI0025B71F42|nr:LysR family transcriptional regulator [Paenibacillus polymyxa]MDN4086091.1 LysR family transcriptional regulator [Paenibacillus polymyxa]MDN4087088.1 LysR family transcriptional regulator [Paenibacillus polymyxa]MDN4108710.1 LysR family transcriptional regulator [Paenibacillus polymyxa]
MDLKELTTFRTIIEEGTFSKAAAKLNYAQSTVTNQIQRLEKELGFQLFKRGWDAELTSSGKMYAKEVDGLIRHWNFVMDQAKSLKKEEIGTLHIGVLETVATTALPLILRQFREHKPKITCHFTVGNTDALSKALLDGTLDFAISGEPHSIPSLHFEPLYQEQIAFIVSRSHPFAARNELQLEDLYEYPLIVGGKNCLYHIRLEKELSLFPSMPFFYTVSQISSIPSFVHTFPSVGVVLSSMPLQKDLVTIPLQLTDPNIPIGLLQNNQHPQYLTSAQRLFMQLVKKTVGNDTRWS